MLFIFIRALLLTPKITRCLRLKITTLILFYIDHPLIYKLLKVRNGEATMTSKLMFRGCLFWFKSRSVRSTKLVVTDDLNFFLCQA